MSNTTMTTREFLNHIVNYEKITEADVSKARELLAALDKRNEKRKSTDSKEKKEAAERREQVLNFLRSNEGEFTREQIAEGVGFAPSKVTGACTALVKDGLVSKSKVKVDKTEKMAYSAI